MKKTLAQERQEFEDEKAAWKEDADATDADLERQYHNLAVAKTNKCYIPQTGQCLRLAQEHLNAIRVSEFLSYPLDVQCSVKTIIQYGYDPDKE